MKKIVLVILIFILSVCSFSLLGCGKDNKEEKHQPEGSYKIAFLGDSLTDKGVYSDIVTTHYTD